MNDPRGSKWRKWDLHFHTPKSHDHGNKGMSAKAIVDRLVDARVEIVAVTDHHVMDVSFIEEMRKAAGDQLTVLPGIELSCPLGGHNGVHFIGIFAEDHNLTYLSNEIQSATGISRQRADGKNEQQLYVDFLTAANAIKALGGVISIHAHQDKTNSIENIANNSALKMEFKKDITRKYIDFFEVGRKQHCDDYRAVVFPAIGFIRPLIVGSDDHCDDRHHADKRYPAERRCWIKADPTFAGLKMALREPEYRFCLDAAPPEVDRVEKNKTKYIKSVSFTKLPTMPTGEEWLNGEVLLNPGLVAIIGNKGSGKSALSDCIGLLGSCTTSDAFSFLEPHRFRHAKTGRAAHVEATMSWHGGNPVTRSLNDDVAPDEPERVKYLPQNFVERVCNDLATPGGGAFERELKKVVFSKVAPEDRLGKGALDELVAYRTEELRHEANDLAQSLIDLGEQRARLEERLDPSVRTGLERRIVRKKEEINSHEDNKPEEQEAPPDDPAATPEAAKSIEELDRQKTDREKVVGDIETRNQIVRDEQQRASTAEKLLAKLDNLKSTVERSIDDMSPEAHALGLKPEDLASLRIDRDPVTTIHNDAINKRDAAREEIGTSDSEPLTGLVAKRIEIDARIKELQDKLSRPQQKYQAYLDAKKKWDETLRTLRGTADDSESLAGLEAELRALDNVPEQIQRIEDEQHRIAEAIHTLRVNEAEVYTELYAPIQRFIEHHDLASEHLKLEFKVEIVEDRFADNLLGFINQNKIGSFHGIEEGEKMARRLVSRVNWSNWDSVKEFLHAVVKYLHRDMREGREETEVLLGSQVGKGRTAAELYRWLYALAYLKPRYLLRWDGKDVEQLSPGERGTLLLIFYLLVDDSDLPLVIDQPEANLDNDTVAKKLVHCIRDARGRRQVVIVTHNPNLAVVCDADQIIHASMDKPAGNKIGYESGALEHPEMNRFTINVLEGGRDPFDMRDDTYQVVGE